MQNRDLRTLQEIARLGSFSDAAERLNMTLSAVSMQMKALERDLDAALFDRKTRPPRLTPLGRRVADAAGDVLAKETALRALVGPETPLAGRFRLGLVASAGPRLLPGFLRRLPDALPHSRFDVQTGLSENLQTLVITGALDAAVLTATGVPPGGLRQRVIAQDRLVIAGPVGGDPSLPFLHFAPTTGIGRLIAAELAHHPILRAAPRLVLDHVETILACLADGVGRTILPEVDLNRVGVPLERRVLSAERHLVLVTRQGSTLDLHGDRLAGAICGHNPTGLWPDPQCG
ncbi:LysR family transcriptional regulator [Jannaschia pagri]|uniref:LysR family transcriptional regulator n=1 Tax=Jannaschia pagri TaxID=2829797 RepID=A0ABQ4NNA1_9RHOB|nr:MULTISPECIES: LysR family transcriptional regulator [unclassified Jannaschia]GIT92019.1 LysR family transcriptional regulator [Jannaschia sp. AI_61]GIT95853.1 LysR family transcriptional regulator [Jannaschia sp. AI_62]